MKEWRDVASLDQLVQDGRVIVRVGGREIGVFLDRSNGTFRALRNRCPHVGSPLCRGTLRRRERGTPGAYLFGDQEVLRCPHHGWEFDVETGLCIEDPTMRVAVYAVRTVNTRVEILA